MRLAKEIENPFVEAAVLFFRGCVRSARGEWAGAIRDLAECRRIAQPIGDLFRVFIASSFEARAELMAGNLAAARSLLEEALALLARLGTRFLAGRADAWFAECLLQMGEAEAAAPYARDAIRISEELDDPVSAAFGYRALSQALFHANPSDWRQAEDAMLTALQLQQEAGVRPEIARSYTIYAGMLAQVGQRERATELLAKATEMVGELGMVGVGSGPSAGTPQPAASLIDALRPL